MASRYRRRLRDGADPEPRKRIGHEAPGVALHGPRLTVTCSCGHRERVRHGDSWTCETCGRTWDTGRIPRAEYNEIRRLQLRFRALPVALGLLVVAGAAFFTLSGYTAGVVLLLPIALLTWGLIRGIHRRRYAAAIARRRSWTLRGEP